MRAFWLGVVCREHVLRATSGSFVQLCHGKRLPLSRLKPGDGLVCYSPTEAMGSRRPLREFTALGTVRDDRIYSFEMAPGFIPWRRDVDFVAEVRSVPLEELRFELEFTQGKGWGMALRRGLVPLSTHDFNRIAEAMAGGASA